MMETFISRISPEKMYHHEQIQILRTKISTFGHLNFLHPRKLQMIFWKIMKKTSSLLQLNKSDGNHCLASTSLTKQANPHKNVVLC